ncbi:hypothetical protein Tco_0739165 [Tanacetum coccineum]
MSSDEEWEESGYENPPNGDSILEPYVDAHNKNAKPSKRNFHTSKTENIIPKEVPRSSNMNDRQPNKKVCKVEKFEDSIPRILGFGIRRIDPCTDLAVRKSTYGIF